MIWAQQGLSPCYRSGNKLQTTGLFWSPGQQTQVRPKSTFYAFLRVLPAMTTRPVGISRTGVGLVSNDGDMTCLAGGSEKQKWAKGLSDKQEMVMSWKSQFLGHQRQSFKACSSASPTLGKLTERVWPLSSQLYDLHRLCTVNSQSRWQLVGDVSGRADTWISSTLLNCLMILENLSSGLFFF